MGCEVQWFSGVIGVPGAGESVADRLTFNAHIIETGTDSYRLRVSTLNRER